MLPCPCPLGARNGKNHFSATLQITVAKSKSADTLQAAEPPGAGWGLRAHQSHLARDGALLYLGVHGQSEVQQSVPTLCPWDQGTGNAPVLPGHAGLKPGVAMRLSFSWPTRPGLTATISTLLHSERVPNVKCPSLAWHQEKALPVPWGLPVTYRSTLPTSYRHGLARHGSTLGHRFPSRNIVPGFLCTAATRCQPLYS